ncbi:MAG: DUF1289 domain-containing protein [Rhodobacteraceae bacterium]|nr:DUF1289 domain-containing protein [Paracoccaceae bacterium]
MDETWTREEVDSPCVGLCVIQRECGFCIGCHRTGDEISRWNTMSNEARRAVLAALPARGSALLPKRRGGRKGRK